MLLALVFNLFLPIILFNLTNLSVNGDEEPGVKVVFMDDFYDCISMELGGQAVCVGLAFQFPDLIVVDAECGKQRKDCPRYCRNSFQLPSYCDPDCQKLGMSDSPYCGDSLAYDSRNSTTFKDLHKSIIWTYEFSNPHRLFGKAGQDRLDVFDNFFPEVAAIHINKFKFVRGLILDRRFIDVYGAILGLLPNKHNLIWQLYNQKIIRSPKFALSYINNNFGFMSKVAIFGAFDEENCENWTYHKSMSENAWQFEIEVASVNGILHTKNWATIDLQLEGFLLPPEFTNKLLKSNILLMPEVTPTSFPMYIAKNYSLTLTLKMGDRLVYFNGSEMFDNDYNGTHIYSNILINMQSTLYENTTNWIFGKPLCYYYCCGLDFENHVLGLADNTYGRDR